MRKIKIPIPKELRERVFKRDDYTCQYCGSIELPLHADHVYPESRGGETSYENLITACRKCNGKKGAKVGKWPRQILVTERVEVRIQKRVPVGFLMGVGGSLFLSYTAGVVLNLFPPVVVIGLPFVFIAVGMFFVSRGKA